MRTEDEIRADLSAVTTAFQAKRDTLTPPEMRKHSDAVKALQVELGVRLAEGAEPCEDCDSPAFGLRHFKADMDRGSGRPIPYSEYEVGCLNCGHKRALSRQARHDEPGALDKARAEAVERWNAMKYLEPKPWQLDEAVARIAKHMEEGHPGSVEAARAAMPFAKEGRDATQDEAFAFLAALRAARRAQVGA